MGTEIAGDESEALELPLYIRYISFIGISLRLEMAAICHKFNSLLKKKPYQI